ncbi:MAG: PHP domain-containing protein [Chloroflexi bacterium]|nr:PHP domain-containing protein [Chloroflexota bacterium]
MVRIDMHVHTEYSPDCATTLQEVINTARAMHLDYVAITDHNRVEGALRLREMAPQKIIVGEEIKTTGGEVIGLFLEKYIPPRLSPEDTVAKIKEQGGLVYIPHPFDRLRKSPLKAEKLLSILSQVDILEVQNSRCLLRADNQRAETFAVQHQLLRGAGSDGHIAAEIGASFVEMSPFESKEQFLQNLQTGRVVGRYSGVLVHFVSTWNKFRKKR